MQAKKEYFFKTMQTKTGKDQIVCGISTEVVTAELLDEISKNNFDIAVFDKNVVEFADGSFKERNCGKFYFGSAINLQKIGTEAFALADDVCVAQAFLNVEEIGESAFFETRCNMHAALPNANVLHMPKLKKAPAYCFSAKLPLKICKKLIHRRFQTHISEVLKFQEIFMNNATCLRLKATNISKETTLCDFNNSRKAIFFDIF